MISVGIKYTSHLQGDYGLVKETCNSFREANDFDGTYTRLIEIFDHYKNKQDIYTKTFGPGSWFDPDQLGIGYPGFTLDQSKLQMAVYAVMAAPLFISTDLRKIQPEFLDILLNKYSSPPLLRRTQYKMCSFSGT